MGRTATEQPLSRRERQVMDVVVRLGEGAVADVLRQVPDAAGYNAIRNTLNILVRKGHLRRRREGVRHLFMPVVSRRVAGRAAARRLLRTFFAGEPIEAVLTLLSEAERDLTDAQLAEIRAWIDNASEPS